MKYRELTSRPITATLFATAAAFVFLWAAPAWAQTFTVLHEFTGGADGSNPYSSLVLDRAGNLYGTGIFGGTLMCQTQNGIGCGTAFKLARRGTGWVFSTLYEFTDHGDGANPTGSLTIAPDGTLYGATNAGGNLNCRDTFGDGCGTVFRLQPQPNFCASFSCPWIETQLYKFTGHNDGSDPWAGVVLDQAGNVYGTTFAGGSSTLGVVYELSRSGSNWTESTIHTFTGGSDGASPISPLIVDAGGNLYGTTTNGGGCNQTGCGTVFQLTNSGSQWDENILYSFSPSFANPLAALIFDSQGNLYGAATVPNSVFELSPSNGGWSATLLYSDESLASQSFRSTLARDAAGNLYGTSAYGGKCPGNGCGFVYKLTPSGGSWTFTVLYSFTGGSDGANPIGGVVLDSNGNLYGTAYSGGTHTCAAIGCGVAWEITP